MRFSSKISKRVHPTTFVKDMDTVINKTTRLSQMVDDIMDYSKFQSGYGKLNIVAGNLYELIITEVDATRYAAAEYGISMSERLLRRGLLRLDCTICMLMKKVLIQEHI